MSIAYNGFLRQSMRCRYRTVMCKDFPRCNRDVCFFAHTQDEIRRVDQAWSWNQLVITAPAKNSGYSLRISSEHTKGFLNVLESPCMQSLCHTLYLSDPYVHVTGQGQFPKHSALGISERNWRPESQPCGFNHHKAALQWQN